MAKIIENRTGRRSIRLNTEDIINIVTEYQNFTYGLNNYSEIRNKLKNIELFLPEDVWFGINI